MSTKGTHKKYRFLRRILRILLGILLFLLVLILFIRSPWGQGIIVQKAVSYISNKTNTKVKIDKLFLTFQGGLQIDGLYLEDKKGDTLIFSKSLEANIPLWKMVKGEAFGVDNLEWKGLRANIIREDSVSGYNFQFLIDAFTSKNSTQTIQETTASTTNSSVGSLNLKNIDVVFKDHVVGISSRFRIGNLKADMKTIDIKKMIFKANEISLSNSTIKFIQHPDKSSTSKKPTLLPILSANSISMVKVKAHYQLVESELIANANIVDFYSEFIDANVADNNLSINTIVLKNSTISLKTRSKTTTINANIKEPNEIVWPKLNLNITKLDLKNNDIQYFANAAKVQKKRFNPDAISLEKLTLKASDFFLQDKNAGIQISELNFVEKSGFTLDQLSLKTKITDTKLEVSQFIIGLNKSEISGFFKANYTSLSKLITTPENTNVQLVMPDFKILLDDFFIFQPTFEKNEYLKKISKKQIAGQLNVSGSLADLNIANTHINWGASTQIILNGSIKNSTNLNLIQLNLPNFKLKTSRLDVLQIANQKELNINFPSEMVVSGSLTGTRHHLKTDTKITTTQGIATLKGAFKNEETTSFDVDLALEAYKIGEFLKNPNFGKLSVSLNCKGTGTSVNNLDATLKTTISKFQFNNYTITNANISGKVKNGKGKVTSSYKDENLNLKLNALVALDAIATKTNLNLNIIGANLKGLGIMNRNVKTGMDIELDFEGNQDKYSLKSTIKDGVFVYDNRTYLVGLIKADAFVNKDTTAISIQNKLLNVSLESNANPQTFGKAIQHHAFRYFYRDTKAADTILDPVNLKFTGKIAQTPLLKDVFLVNIKELDTINFSIDFNEKERKLNASITAPHINYDGNEIDSLAFFMKTNQEDFYFKFGFKNIIAGPLNVPETSITGNQTNNELSLKFLALHQGKKRLNVDAKVTGNRAELILKVNPNNVLLNNKNWQIPIDNVVILTKNNLTFTNFKISKNNQSIEVTNDLEGVFTKHIALKYQNFKISEFFDYLNPDKEIVNGTLNGNFILENPFSETGIIANLNVSELLILKTNLGKLTIDAKSLGNNQYDFNAKLKGGEVDLSLKGDYYLGNDEANLDLNLQINEFKMNALNTLSLNQIKEGSGSFSGDFKMSGTLQAPIYNGNIKFNNAGFNILKLNTKFTLPNETLLIDNKGLKMSNLNVQDTNKNKLVLSGEINTTSFINPSFDLKVKANNFRVLNAKKEDNPSLYGEAFFNVNAKLTGDLRIPKLNADLTLGSASDFTYVLPSSYVNIEERDGVVLFVNKKNPNAILTKTEKETAIITGFDIFAKLKTAKDAKATIIIDKETGDNFEVSGEGDVIFAMKPNGQVSLTGIYEISKGHYELNLYNLVTRKFSLSPGSRISWSGDPLDAKLNVSAFYSLETAALPLMAAQVSGKSPEETTTFKQKLPFDVYLNIDGELLQPKISFNLDMPKDERGAIGGQVYGRVQQINQQEDELNKQVFSLLVLNRFYPDAGSDGSSGGFATLARDNLNDAVAEQLNTVSNKILGDSGVELDFGLNSFTDYQGNAPTERTQLDVAAKKKLFNDRFTVRVGSEIDIQGSDNTGSKTPLIGNVSLEYNITEDGRFRIKGFRKSEFENVIDGQTIVSGIALIFTKEFNEFRELWKAVFKAKREKVAANKKANKVKKKDAVKDNNLAIKKKNK